MVWIWGLWAAAAVLMVGTAIALEVSMLRNRVDGANGLLLFVSLVMAGGGSLAVVIVSWVARDGRTALIVTAVAALALGAAFKLALVLTERVGARRK